jgi:hypothetical protein
MNNNNKVNKHVNTLITYLVLVPLVYFVPEILKDVLPDNKLLSVMVVVGIIVPVISYLVMPFVEYVRDKELNK